MDRKIGHVILDVDAVQGGLFGIPGLPPLLRWVGGKRWIIPHVEQYHRPRQRIVEPFAGALAVSLGLGVRHVLANDLNIDLINFHRQVRDGLTIDPVDVRLAATEAGYYQMRDEFNGLIEQGQRETPRAAQLFYVLNRAGYAGLCRYNRDGLYNVPFGYGHKKLLARTDFWEYVLAMKQWEFVSGDFADTPLQPGDLVFVDPPYADTYDGYNVAGFSMEDQERLIRWLDQHDGTVILCNQATPEIVAMYERNSYDIKYISRKWSSAVKMRTDATEIIAVRKP